MDDFDSLRICPACDCRFCFEAAAEPLTPELWLVVLQCPNCWHAWSRTTTDAALELLEYALDDDMRLIAASADELGFAYAVAEAEAIEGRIRAFVAALQADGIVPMDF
jgi:hypothetical protein